MSDRNEFVDVHHPETGGEGRMTRAALSHQTSKGWKEGKLPASRTAKDNAKA